MSHIGLNLSEFEMNSHTTILDKLFYLRKVFSVPNLPYLLHHLPVFPVYSSQIKILTKPQEFYNELLSEASKANKRIVMASLYIGTGGLEKQLVSAISDRLEHKPELKVRWLLDYTRASRGETNSRTVLLPLLKDKFNCKVSLFHTPLLRGLTKLLLPERWNEIIGLQHMKIYVCDDTVIISGANLSHDYFVNRQDRYLMVRDCHELADFYEDLVSAVGLHSLQLKADDTAAMERDTLVHPFKGNFQKYCKEFNSSIQGLWSSALRQSAARLEREFPSTAASASGETGVTASASGTPPPDTLVFPTIQMAHFDIHTDSEATSNFLQSVLQHSRIHLATGYFNLTNQYVTSILHHSNSQYKILCAHPTANGFLGAKGFAGGIPAAYTNLCKHFYGKVVRACVESRVRICEYALRGWTFHAKGLWYFPPSDASPSTTLIGSPNFGYRSVHRDLETQVFVCTACPSLRQRMSEEQERLYESSSLVTRTTFEAQDRVVPLWVKLVTYFLKFFF